MRILLALAAALVGHAALAEPVVVSFAPLAGPLQEPERGFWRFAGDDLAGDVGEALRGIRAAGLTLAYAPVRLDDYRDRPLPQALVDAVERSLAEARAAGVKVILRFAYNGPGSSSEYEDAQDAPLPVVLGHIAQVGPLLARNADTVAVLQAGFIGAWGEGHTSSNGLDAPVAKAAVRDALLTVLPQGMPIQWRYPGDLAAWEAEGRLGPFGFHNDCFLSSPTDVGTFPDEPAAREALRGWAATRTERTFFSGETCDAEPRAARLGCGPILAEGAAFHLSALGLDYWRAFHESWERQGCLGEVEASLGYRLRLVEARIDDARIEVDVANDGWAALARPRPLLLRAGAQEVVLGPVDLNAVAPGTITTLSAPLPDGAASTRLCLAAPDPSPRLAADPRFAIRPANADTPSQRWERGAFCFDWQP